MSETQKSRQATATRSQLVAVGRQIFAEKGFAGTSTEEIVAHAGVTRGALYYHFKSKEDLFLAVVAEVEEAINGRVTAAAMGSGEPWAGLVDGCGAFLDACLDPGTRRIALVDAPSVLGWEAWRELSAQHSLGTLVTGLNWCIVAGVIVDQPVVPLAHLVLGALNEAALYVARAPDQEVARTEVAGVIGRVLEGLRSR